MTYAVVLLVRLIMVTKYCTYDVDAQIYFISDLGSLDIP